jgi:iron complex transport system substrate-binding protein
MTVSVGDGGGPGPGGLFVVDYDIPFEQKKDILMNTPSMKDVTAVTEGRIYRIEFSDIMAGRRVGTTAEKVAEQLRSIGK